MKVEKDEAVKNLRTDLTVHRHDHPQKRSWPWLIAAFVLCPCHLVIVLAVLGTGAIGGLLTRNLGVLFVVFTAGFGLALWRLVAASRAYDSCPACRSEGR